MKIRITDIPADGRTLSFTLDEAALNLRVNPHRADSASVGAKTRYESKTPDYLFISAPEAVLDLKLHGSSVTIKGQASGTFRTPCSRCAEDLEQSISVAIDIILKPRPANARPDDVEDLGYGYYDDKEIDCADIVEEHIILGIPYAVTCPDSTCDKLTESILTSETPISASEGDERFAALRGLRLNGNKSQS